MLRLRRSPLTILAVAIFALTAVRAQQPGADAPKEEYIRAHYTKYEYRIPMRDGKRLFTSVYVPKDAAGGPYPFLMVRTPYGVDPYGEDQYPEHLGPSDEFEKSGYIFVYQDVRGRWMSEGDFVEMRPHIDVKKSPQDVDDSSDTSDTIDFLLKHVPNNNGKVGIWGISYPGFYTSASIIDSHPALVAASPQAPMTDLFLGRRRVSRRRLHAFGQLRLLCAVFSSAREPAGPQTHAAIRFRHPGSATGSISKPGTSPTSTSST